MLPLPKYEVLIWFHDGRWHVLRSDIRDTDPA
jgi:hypothetical protein